MNLAQVKQIIATAIDEYVKTANGLPLSSVKYALTMHIFNKLKSEFEQPLSETTSAAPPLPVEEKSDDDLIAELKKTAGDNLGNEIKVQFDEPYAPYASASNSFYSTPMNVYIKRSREHINIPTYASEFSSGFDVEADLTTIDAAVAKFNKKLNIDYVWNSDNVHPNIIILPHRTIAIPTGLFFEIPKGTELQVRPRSGNSIKLGLAIANSPGTVDADYRGEIMILVTNTTDILVQVEHKMKIAQLVLMPVLKANLIQVSELNDTARGDGGFGKSDTTKYENK